MKECLLYKKLAGNKVQCRACWRYCVIENNKRGKCGVRENKNGELFSLVYGQPCAINIDPIEKKPLYHFLPGTKTLSIATVGCNFLCAACQNWQISQVLKVPGGRPRSVPRVLPPGYSCSPDEIIEMALKSNCPSISYTYTEPTVFLEYALDIMKLAKAKGLKNIWVSNGYFSPETFELIKDYLDAANIDLKGFTEEFYQKYCGAKLAPVLDNLKRLKGTSTWLEITTLVIPSLNDSPETFEKIASFIKTELDPETPWHISRFFGDVSWKLQHLPDTPLETLKTAYQIAKSAGLKNVYIGNA